MELEHPQLGAGNESGGGLELNRVLFRIRLDSPSLFDVRERDGFNFGLSVNTLSWVVNRLIY